MHSFSIIISQALEILGIPPLFIAFIYDLTISIYILGVRLVPKISFVPDYL